MAERDRIRDFLGGLQHLELHVEGFAFERENINVLLLLCNINQDSTEAETEAVQSWCTVSADIWAHKLDLKCKITEHIQGLELQI